jgi:hypothetical protein
MFFCHDLSPYVSTGKKEQNPNQRNVNNPVERSAEKHAGMYPICITLGGWCPVSKTTKLIAARVRGATGTQFFKQWI